MVKLTFLGTNGWFDSSISNTVCALLESARDLVILDARFSISKLDHYIPAGTKKDISLFLSHLNPDHIRDLHLYL